MEPKRFVAGHTCPGRGGWTPGDTNDLGGNGMMSISQTVKGPVHRLDIQHQWTDVLLITTWHGCQKILI